MIDEKKVKLMTRMASYENNEGREDLKVSAYYRKDYVSYHTVCSILWVTIGYGCMVLLIGLCMFDKLLGSMSMETLMAMAVTATMGYLAVVVIYALITYVIYNKRHQKARMRIKKYNHDLTRLLKIYEKENQ